LRLLLERACPLTLHAGEADSAERVLQAGRLGAKRIGHGVRLVDALHDARNTGLVEEAKAMGLHLEVCPTSNVHTGAAQSIATHPITALWRAGVSVSYHTDNRLMSCITQSSEAARLLAHTPLTRSDLLAMAAEAARHSFLPEAKRQPRWRASKRLRVRRPSLTAHSASLCDSGQWRAVGRCGVLAPRPARRCERQPIQRLPASAQRGVDQRIRHPQGRTLDVTVGQTPDVLEDDVRLDAIDHRQRAVQTARAWLQAAAATAARWRVRGCARGGRGGRALPRAAGPFKRPLLQRQLGCGPQLRFVFLEPRECVLEDSCTRLRPSGVSEARLRTGPSEVSMMAVMSALRLGK
jgi:hypothetical protein